MRAKRMIRRGGHLYYFRTRYATRKGAERGAKSWRDYGSLTLIVPFKAHYLYPKETRTEYRLYATKKVKKK
jgi:hypothetical protein